MMAIGRWAARSPTLPQGAPLGVNALVLWLRTMFAPNKCRSPFLFDSIVLIFSCLELLPACRKLKRHFEWNTIHRFRSNQKQTAPRVHGTVRNDSRIHLYTKDSL